MHLDQHQIDSDVLFASDVPTTEQEHTEGTQNHSILTQSRVSFIIICNSYTLGANFDSELLFRLKLLIVCYWPGLDRLEFRTIEKNLKHSQRHKSR